MGEKFDAEHNWELKCIPLFLKKILCYNSGMEEATEKTVKCQN